MPEQAATLANKAPDSTQCKAIAAILCSVTQDILWQHVQPWLQQRSDRHRLQCRVGSGEATYYSPRGKYQHVLNYGWKMVASKYDPAMARQWQTGRELLQRRYFDGDFALSTVLAHTCCHEFGHVIQGINGWISRGSVHNEDFYRIVDRIHHSGVAQELRCSIEHAAHEQHLLLQFIESERTVVDTKAFAPGELVSFDYRGRVVLGEVLRVNRKTVNVKPLVPRLSAEYFRISPHYLQRSD